MATSKFVVCIFISFLGLASAGPIASVSADSRILSVKKAIMMFLRLRLGAHFEQDNMFELLSNSRYDMSPGLLTYSRSQEVDWSRCKST